MTTDEFTCVHCGSDLAARAVPAATDEGLREIREWAKNVVRSVPPVHISNTDAVPTFKRRPDQCIDRAAVLLAIEHAALGAPDHE